MTGYIKSGIQDGATVHLGASSPVSASLEEGYLSPNEDRERRNLRARIGYHQVQHRTRFFPNVLILRKVVQPIFFIEVIDAANDTDYGLACHIFTENVSRAVRVAHAIDAGTSWVGAYPFRSYFLGTESGVLYLGQLCGVWERGGSFWRIQAVGSREGDGKACVGYVRSYSCSSMCLHAHDVV